MAMLKGMLVVVREKNRSRSHSVSPTTDTSRRPIGLRITHIWKQLKNRSWNPFFHAHVHATHTHTWKRAFNMKNMHPHRDSNPGPWNTACHFLLMTPNAHYHQFGMSD